MSAAFILVSSASGFVGARLVAELVARGERVKAFVRPGVELAGLRELSSERCQIALGEPGQEGAWFRALSQCDRMIYLEPSLSYTDRSRSELERELVTPLEAMLEAASARSIQKAVITSSMWLGGGTREAVAMAEGEPVELEASPFSGVHTRLRELVERARAGGQRLIGVRSGVVVGPGDTEPTPASRLLARYLHTRPGARLAVGRGGVSLVDVDDAVAGYIAALSRGEPGQTYDFSGEALSFAALVDLLSELTGLASARVEAPRALCRRVGWTSVWRRLTGEADELGPELVRALSDRFFWLDASKTERELGVVFRGAAPALGRSVRWFVEAGILPERVTTRIRLELRPA